MSDQTQRTEGHLGWRVHTASLLREVLNNPGTHALRQPFRIFGDLLAQVGAEAARINDPKLNALMCRLTIYSCADPDSPDFDRAKTDNCILAALSEPRP